MEWTLWQKQPEPDPKYRPIARNITDFKAQLVHWTDEHECRVINIEVDESGYVSVEHSTTEHSDSGLEPENITRLTIPGWDE